MIRDFYIPNLTFSYHKKFLINVFNQKNFNKVVLNACITLLLDRIYI